MPAQGGADCGGREGEQTVPARLELLRRQRAGLVDQRRQIEEALERLDKKIIRYEEKMAKG